MPEEAQGRTGIPSERGSSPSAPRRARPAPALGGREPAGPRGLRHPLDEENHELGREHFNAGRFFPAHEAWETAWKQARETDEAEFFKGLSQLGAGYGTCYAGTPTEP